MTAPEGLLVVDKPAGPTSHDVVAAVRSYVAGLRVGHTGTLDPFATGVLPLCVGRATRLARFLTATRKTYTGAIRLGLTTDTYDVEGRVVSETPGASPEPEIVRQAAGRLTGSFMQTPPPYSARKIDGRPMHRLARQGRPFVAKPSPVTVHRFDIVEVAGTLARFVAETSPGTYIRSLAHDLGVALGCGACLAELRREASGGFVLSAAHTMDEVHRRGRDGTLSEIVVPLHAIDLGLPRVVVTSGGLAAMRTGRALFQRDVSSGSVPDDEGTRVRVDDEDGNLLGVARPARDARGERLLQPDVVLTA